MFWPGFMPVFLFQFRDGCRNQAWLMYSDPVLFEEPFLQRLDGSSLGQRFPSRFRFQEVPQTRTSASRTIFRSPPHPGYDNRARLPYAEHFNLSIERELSRSTVLTLAYVGIRGSQTYHFDGGHRALASAYPPPPPRFWTNSRRGDSTRNRSGSQPPPPGFQKKKRFCCDLFQKFFRL